MAPLSPDAETAIHMLERGHEQILLLRLLLPQVPALAECPQDVTWGVLLDDVTTSLGLALSVLRAREGHKDHGGNGAAHRDGSSSSSSDDDDDDDDLRSKASSERRPKRPRTATGDEDHKKSTRLCSRRLVTAAPYDDGYPWRKYGQKQIRGARHRRYYLQCAYRKEQGCPASKQVQQTDNDDPPRFLTIYNEAHTCNSGRITTPHVVVESTSSEQFLIRFDDLSGTPAMAPQQHLFVSRAEGEEPGHRHETLKTHPSQGHMCGSELMGPLGQFSTNTPEVAEARPAATRPSPLSSAPDLWVGSLLEAECL